MKTALISVSDKTNLIPFGKALAERGVQIISTGGTSQKLKEAGVPVTEIKDFTGFPEVMDGRVRTLHPKVHTALLARSNEPEDFKILEELGVPPLDLIVVNLYPFEESLQKNLSDEDLIEEIDIGGPTLLRAAAKNHDRVTVVCDPADYERVLSEPTSLDFRRELAAKVFAHTAYYDSLISQNFLQTNSMEKFSLAGKLNLELRYGENPQQKAYWFQKAGSQEGLHQAQILQGKQLSYNNILDLQAAIQLVRRFTQPCAVFVKHNNPCGVALGSTVGEAVKKALDADPVSAFGGIVAVNCTLDNQSAEILAPIFLECIVAPQWSDDAKAILASKKNLRLLEWQGMLQSFNDWELRTVDGGFLIQNKDAVESKWNDQWQVIGRAPTPKEKKDLLLAINTVASLKSNAIAIVEEAQTLGLGMGQVNRVDAVKHAIDRAQKFKDRLPQAILASDAFFPFPDSIESLAEAGIRYVIQPGGSVKDAEVIEAAKRLDVNMILTGTRHFLH